MRRLHTILLLASAAIISWACPHPIPPSPPDSPVATVACVVKDASNLTPIQGATCAIAGQTGQTNSDGYKAFDGVLKQEWTLKVTAENYNPYSGDYIITGNTNLSVGLTSAHVDPTKFTLTQLAAIRGSMWTHRYPMPWGPRPGQPDNIAALSALPNYATLEEMKPMLQDYAAQGYTHGVIGAWAPGPSVPYHDYYPSVNITFDQYLDILQLMWDTGIAPTVFIKPDNWSCQQLESLTQYYSTPRAQKLVRIAVPGGWEPDKDTPNSEWVCWMKWGARVLPNSLRAIHMPADFDAPGNNDDFTPSSPTYIGMPEAWNRVAPYLHIFFVQNGGYVFGCCEIPTQEFITNFQNQFVLNAPTPAQPQGKGSLRDRFEQGYAGWPTFSAWGSHKGIRPIAAEFAAYADFMNNWAEKYARQLGDLAMAAGAYGYLDGGTVNVPVVLER